MYARTVFDPLTIITANGGWAPYLAESVVPNADYTAWTITLRPNVVFHDGTPCNGAALLTNLEAQAKSLLTGIVLSPTLVSITQTGPLAVTITFKTPWVPFPYYLAGGIGGQIAYVAAPSMLANPNGTSHPVGTGPFVFKEWVPNSHFTATANPHYWRPGLPYLDADHLQADPRRGGPGRGAEVGHHRHHDHRHAADHHAVPGQQEVLLHRRQHPRGRRARHELRPAQLPGQALQQPHRAPGRRHGHQPAAVRQGDRRGHPPGEQRPLRARLAVLLQDVLPGLQPDRGQEAGQGGREDQRRAVSFTFGSTNAPAAIRAQEYLQQAWQEVGLQGHEHDRRSRTTSSTTPWPASSRR